jgi:hypothetical protein
MYRMIREVALSVLVTLPAYFLAAYKNPMIYEGAGVLFAITFVICSALSGIIWQTIKSKK